MLYTNDKKFSLAAVRAAKNAIHELIGGAADFTTMFITMRQAAIDGGCPVDAQAMRECEQMFTTIQRILYLEEANLKHLQHQRLAEREAERQIEAMKRSAAEHMGGQIVKAI